MAAVTETVHLTAQVPADLARELQQLADANDRPRSAEIRLALRAHLERANGGAEEATG